MSSQLGQESGQSHLINRSPNFQEIVTILTSLETFGFDPDFGSLLLSKKIQGEMTEYCLLR